jgi:hypothetical protein
MTGMQTRRDLLKSTAAVSAAVPFANIGIMPSFAAEGAKKGALNGIDETLRHAADAREIPGVVALAATPDGMLYEGAFGKHFTLHASQGLNIFCSAAWLCGVWAMRGPRANAIMAHLFGHLP